ncbi:MULTISPECIES: hypothetical protein [unclassified Nostoc]|uniref:hypothetical protein n=1 Tax=unclassified Nostoc TaxID=2593658 RepID=UPI002AD33E4F|nr:hypothetical protein [Nostoc sp. DedQUE03]MDZ7974742.1 hypothetical protein [Nostoc sp. DedQUE03]MDZ8048055.1 hypothetical protein [Nostoc sp. DedQUE02]
MKQFFYIEPKQNDKYALVGCTDWTNAYSNFEFSELGFCKDDDFYHLFAYATRFTEINKFGDNNWKFEPQLIKMKVARRDYQKENKDKVKLDVKQSRLEKWLCFMFDKLEEEQFYSGFLSLKDDLMCETFVTGLGMRGEVIDPGVLAQMMSMSASLSPLLEAPVHISAEDVQPPNYKGKSGGYGGKPAQTEKEKLQDRLTFICEQVNKFSDGIQVENFAQLIDVIEASENPQGIKEIIGFCTSLMY